MSWRCVGLTSSSFLSLLPLPHSSPSSPGTTVSLLFANQTEEDILVRDMLEAELLAHPDRLKIWYTVDRPPASGWRCVPSQYRFERNYISVGINYLGLVPTGKILPLNLSLFFQERKTRVVVLTRSVCCIQHFPLCGSSQVFAGVRGRGDGPGAPPARRGRHTGAPLRPSPHDQVRLHPEPREGRPFEECHRLLLVLRNG